MKIKIYKYRYCLDAGQKHKGGGEQRNGQRGSGQGNTKGVGAWDNREAHRGWWKKAQYKLLKKEKY